MWLIALSAQWLFGGLRSFSLLGVQPHQAEAKSRWKTVFFTVEICLLSLTFLVVFQVVFKKMNRANAEVGGFSCVALQWWSNHLKFNDLPWFQWKMGMFEWDTWTLTSRSFPGDQHFRLHRWPWEHLRDWPGWSSTKSGRVVAPWFAESNLCYLDSQHVALSISKVKLSPQGSIGKKNMDVYWNPWIFFLQHFLLSDFVRLKRETTVECSIWLRIFRGQWSHDWVMCPKVMLSILNPPIPLVEAAALLQNWWS